MGELQSEVNAARKKWRENCDVRTYAHDAPPAGIDSCSLIVRRLAISCHHKMTLVSLGLLT